MGIQKILNANAEYGVPVKIYTNDIDAESMQQLGKMAQLQFIHSHIAVMPDVHLGKGATVGSVIPTKHAIIPAAVGVDIGCGMNALRLSLKRANFPIISVHCVMRLNAKCLWALPCTNSSKPRHQRWRH